MNSLPAFEPAPDPGRAALVVSSAHELKHARATVIEITTGVGIDEDRAAKFAIAVSEVVTNALVHADGTARMEIITTADRIIVEISDHGSGLPPDRIAELPAVDQDHGRGLWLARQLCDDVEVHRVGGGTLIRLSVDRSASPPHPTST